MDKSFDHALVWFRRDLRADDHAALHAALRAARQVYCGFILDTDILDPLPRKDRRVEFILAALHDLEAQLQAMAARHHVEGVSLIVRHGSAVREVPKLARELNVQAVYASHDDEPSALARDAQVFGHLADEGIILHTTKDITIFERDEVMTGGGTPYSVFTPYKNAWLKKLEPFYLKAYPIDRHAGALAPAPANLSRRIPTLSDIGFEATDLSSLKLPLGTTGAEELLDDFLDRIDDYEDARNFPSAKGPSYLSAHLRFGTVSIRRLAREAHDRMTAGSRGAEVWLSELIWRDFYHQVLHHHPRVVDHAFREEYDHLRWAHGKHADELFHAWCEGRTGYPLVDAAMRQLVSTGYMHNRLRMVAASFLVKDLGLDWRRGEAFFALWLNDFDLAANNGGWQWAASTGTDAQPYFRIFNPVSQSQKFDPAGKFIRRYVPEVADLPDRYIHAPWQARPLDLEAAGLRLDEDYPRPVVGHDEARQATLERFAAARSHAKR